MIPSFMGGNRFYSLTPALTILFINCFCMIKKARSRGVMMIKVAAQTFDHCISASFDFAKIARPTVSVRFVGDFVTMRGQR